MNFNIKEYINLPLILNEFGIDINESYLFNYINDNIDIGCTYNYNIVTSDNNPLTKNNLPYDDLSYILKDKYIEKRYNYNTNVTTSIEPIFRISVISSYNEEYINGLIDKLNERVVESDLVKKILREKNFFSSNSYVPEKGFLYNDDYVDEIAFKNLNLYLVYYKSI
jgi:hypothetical protein